MICFYLLYNKQRQKNTNILLKGLVVKNTVLALVLTASVGPIAAYYHPGCDTGVTINFAPCCTAPYYDDPYYFNDHSGSEYHHYGQCLPSEKYLRRQLYWLYNYNPRSLELHDFPVDYFINTLTDHIKVLENKIAQKNSGLRSNAMLRGTLFSAFSAVWGYVAYESYLKSLKAGSQDTIGGVVILSSVTALLAALGGQQFDRVYRYAERLLERLDRDKEIRGALENIKFLQNSSVE